MACQSQGIQQLLAAEKIAAEKVSEARKRKQKRVKQARDEAKEDIEKYRSARERQFLEFESKKMGCKEDIAAKIDEDTQKKIAEIITEVANIRGPIIEQLITLVIDIEPKVHRCYRRNMK
ncbi:Vacuolar H[+] ATPase 13kD subunit [Carabus blaptoides fortunei]